MDDIRKKIAHLIFWAACILLMMPHYVYSQQVTNVRVFQEGENVIIFYNLSDQGNNNTYNIDLLLSENNGQSFSIRPKNITGALLQVSPGNDKKIIWKVLEEMDQLVGENFVFKITASAGSTAELSDHKEEQFSNTLIWHTVKAGETLYSISRMYGISLDDIKNYNLNISKTPPSVGQRILIPKAGPEAGDSGIFRDERDGKVYKWIRLGSQVWMAENLAFLPYVSPPSAGSAAEPYYYVYGYSGTDINMAKSHNNYKLFGVLYNWTAAITSSTGTSDIPVNVQGACPDGWHLPKEEEWKQLEDYLSENGYNYDGTNGGGRDKIGKAMAGSEGWGPGSKSGSVGNLPYKNNKSGFNASPGGLRSGNRGIFDNAGQFTNWWSSTESFEDKNSALRRYLYSDAAMLGRYFNDKSNGFSVRCIRD